jgi:flagellar motor component MotA
MTNAKPLDTALVEDASQKIQNVVQIYTEDASASEVKLGIENEIRKADHKTRERLIIMLGVVSISWLIFTGFIIMLLGLGNSWYHLSDGVAIAFITTSLGTVLGLWAIGLRYFFSREKI